MVEKCCYNIFFMECFSGKEDVDKRRQENNKTLLIVCVFYSKLSFMDIYLIYLTHLLLGAGSFLFGPHLVYT